jgi:hypothetical protein
MVHPDCRGASGVWILASIEGIAMTGRRSQRKGKRGELEAAARLSELLGVEAKRGAQKYLFGWQAPDVYGVPGCHIEIKRHKRESLTSWMRQAVADACGKIPVVIHRPNRAEWLLTIRLNDLPAFAKCIGSILDRPKRKSRTSTRS